MAAVTRRVRGAPWALFVAAACVLVVALGSAQWLRANGDARAATALKVANFETEVLELHRVAAVGALPSMNDAGRAATRDQITVLRRAYEAARREVMARLGADDRRRLEAAASPFVRDIDELLARLRSGAATAPVTNHVPAVEAAFGSLHRVLDGINERALGAAEHARALEENSFVVILALTAMGVAALAGMAGVATRRAALVAAESEAVRRSDARFRALENKSHDITVVTDHDGRVREISASLTNVLGLPPHHVTGRNITELVHPDERGMAKAQFERVLSGGSVDGARWRCRDASGSWRYLETSITNLLDVPDVEGIVFNVRDVTERQGLEDELRHRAFHDSLTGLANRALLRDRIGHAMARRQPRGAALLLLDLDAFKDLNDSLGHPAGDHALVVVADRIRRASRPGDTVARLGGDEFAVLVEEPVHPDEAVALGERLIGVVSEPFLWEGHEVSVGTSIGVAFVEPRLDGADDLVRNADVALYTAKACGRGQVRVFEASMHDATRARFEVLTELRHAIDNGELLLHYQPVVELDTRRVVGVEALVRWQHPTRGLLTPESFICFAEESGLIVPLGEWVLGEACRAAARWPEQHPGVEPIYVAVNLSARQLDEPDIVTQVARALEASGLDPGRLVLEITETTLMQNVQEALARINSLRGLGVRLAVDDFGTGYSSLSYLHRFPVDTVKIDKAFVDDIASGDDTTFLAAILSLGHALRVDTLAEGIETADQAVTLANLGCRLGQGYHFARPLDSAGLDRVLRAHDVAFAAAG